MKLVSALCRFVEAAEKQALDLRRTRSARFLD
jgi:hypothetical protein